MESELIMILSLGLIRRDSPGSSCRDVRGSPQPELPVAHGNLQNLVTMNLGLHVFYFFVVVVKIWRKHKKISLTKKFFFPLSNSNNGDLS